MSMPKRKEAATVAATEMREREGGGSLSLPVAEKRGAALGC